MNYADYANKLYTVKDAREILHSRAHPAARVLAIVSLQECPA